MGSAATALLAWLDCRARGGRFILRVEDLDRPRVVAGAEERQLEDLLWLGLDWDEGPDVGGPAGPYRQSQRLDHYQGILDRLVESQAVYFCDCSRSELQRLASAPHAGEEGPRYPGLCRPFGLTKRPFRRPPCIRLAVPAGTIAIEDRVQGTYHQDVEASIGDFVLRRGDGVFTYQLAVVADDLAMGITDVVRGYDLLASSPRQAVLAMQLGSGPPCFAHTPLIAAPDGTRLAKRDGQWTLREVRRRGMEPAAVLEVLARTLGLEKPRGTPLRSPHDLLANFDLRSLTRHSPLPLSGV